MSLFSREHFEAMLRGDAPMPAWLRVPLSGLAKINRAGMARRLGQAPIRVDAHVVSFGNLTLGGTGKTPAVIERAAREVAAGRKPVVVTRGYHAERTEEPLLLAPGAVGRVPSPETAALARRFGDEPALIAWRVPGCAIAKGRDRVAAAEAAIRAFGCDVVLLDDGYQYVRLARDENILLVDASMPLARQRVFPAGYLREPLAAASRATEILYTRCDQAGDLATVEAEIGALCPGIPYRRTTHRPVSLVRLDDGAELPLDAIGGKKIDVLCGIAQPQAFLATLASLGANVREGFFLRDHARPEIRRNGGRPLIITEKDAIKLAAPLGNAYALRIEIADCTYLARTN